MADRSERRASTTRIDPLSVALLEVIDRGAAVSIPDEEFDRLARAVFRRQFDRNAIYRAFCEARRALPDTVRHWSAIPAVPTDAFKLVPLICGDPASAAAAFRTSGTTSGRDKRGTHYLLDTTYYRAALRQGFRHALLPDTAGMRILSLIPPLGTAPDSSLSFMLDEVLAAFGSPGSRQFVATEGIQVPELLDAFAVAVRDRVPVLLAGTSLAFVHLLETMRSIGTSIALPPGSRIMDTGGFKGHEREVSRGELYASIRDRLGIGLEFIVNEYGMTEMSSQFYDGVAGLAHDAGVPRLHRGPPWVRSVAVDPETLRPLPDGAVGILRHLDLANLDSVVALQTSDLGRTNGGEIELLGRAAGATPRGCSIAMDELLLAAGDRGDHADAGHGSS